MTDGRFSRAMAMTMPGMVLSHPEIVARPSSRFSASQSIRRGPYRRRVRQVVMTEDPRKFGIQPSGIIAAAAGVEQ